MHECEDEHDAEWLKKQQTKIKKSKEFCKALQSEIPDDYFDSLDSYCIAEFDASVEDLDVATAYM
jgi:hypothetical protein